MFCIFDPYLSKYALLYGSFLQSITFTLSSYYIIYMIVFLLLMFILPAAKILNLVYKAAVLTIVWWFVFSTVKVKKKYLDISSTLYTSSFLLMLLEI